MIAWAWVALLGAASLLGAELASRWWIRHRTRYHVWPPGMRLELQQDAALFPEAEPRVRFDVNADGERGSDVPRNAPGLFRILVAGGSPAECFALDQFTSWPGALERLLNTTDTLRTLGASRAHVGNIGRGGIASEHLDVIFEHALPQYRRLGLIVVLVGGNDVFQWLEQGAPTSLPVPSVTAADVFQYQPGQRFAWTPRGCATLALARRLRRSWFRPLEVRERASAWVTAARKMRAEATELRTSVPDPAVMVNHFERNFRRLLLRAQAHADRVLVVRQPWFEKDYTPEEAGRLWHGGLGKAWKQAISVYYAQDVLNCLMQLVDARAAAVATELGVEHLDLRPVLAPTLENYYDFVHYTPTGAAVGARTVAAAILRRSGYRGSSPHSGKAPRERASLSR